MADLVRLLRAAGLEVVDSRVPSAPGSFTPVGVVGHHTAAGTNVAANRRVLQHGRTGVPGPLCNVYVRRDGVAEVITDGRANDTGQGSATVLSEVRAGRAVHRDARDRGITDTSTSGNRWFYDVELDNLGTGEPYPTAQVATAARVCAALLDHLGRDTGSMILHRQWTHRKIDPSLRNPDLIALTARHLEDDVTPEERKALEFAGRLRAVVEDELGSNAGWPRVTIPHVRDHPGASSAEVTRLRREVDDLRAALAAIGTGGTGGLSVAQVRAIAEGVVQATTATTTLNVPD